MSVHDADKSKPYLPLAGGAQDGYSNATEATATCFCGAVQLAFALKGVSDPHLCNCTDCHKIHSSLFGSNFVVPDDALRHIRGKEELSSYSTSKTVGTGNTMTNHFCRICGSLMYKVGTGFPGKNILRTGTVDEFNLMETLLKPEVEQFVKDRVSWLGPARGVAQVDGYHFG